MKASPAVQLWTHDSSPFDSRGSATCGDRIPHELGDFALLLNAGYSRTRALELNGLSESAGLWVHRGSIHIAAPWQVILVAAGVLTVAVL